MSRGPSRAGAAEIAARLAITEEHVAEALEAIDTRCRCSLDEPIGANGTTSLGRCCCPPRPARSSWRTGWRCPSCWPACPSWSGERSCCGTTATFKQHEIGAMLGYSQIHVSRLLRRALSHMREQLSP
jgi:hypothetical protein